MAVDREFEYKFWLEFGWREAGGLRSPATPCFPGGALRDLGRSGWSLFRDRATCLWRLRCVGQILFSQKSDFF